MCISEAGVFQQSIHSRKGPFVFEEQYIDWGGYSKMSKVERAGSEV